MSAPDPGLYLSLAGHALLRRLEAPCLYDRAADELYELNQEGFDALLRCRGHLTVAQVGLEPEFLEYCLAGGLLITHSDPRPRPLAVGPGPVPSLRYLELQVTWRCNLACAHCYLGPARGVDLPVPRIAAVLREFEAMGGLRLLISGGEPLMHPHWDQVNALLSAYPLRRVLLSNGLKLDGAVLGELAVDEVQISLDGLAPGHEALRGAGTYEQALAAARRVTARGLDLSVATMAHAANLDQMQGLERVVRDLGAREWGIDAPVVSGRLGDNAHLAVPPDQAARAMERAFGGAYHGGGEGMACGLHLCTVAADQKVAQCGFYLDDPLGVVDEGLWTCWQRRRPLAIADLEGCAQCPDGPDCGGGCRFRAAHRLAPDPVMCAVWGRPLPGR